MRNAAPTVSTAARTAGPIHGRPAGAATGTGVATGAFDRARRGRLALIAGPLGAGEAAGAVEAVEHHLRRSRAIQRVEVDAPRAPGQQAPAPIRGPLHPAREERLLVALPPTQGN